MKQAVRLLLLSLLLSFAGFAQPWANFSSTALDTSGVLRVCLGNSIEFRNLSTAAGGATYLWNFGGGGTPNTSVQQDPTISFNSVGTFTANFQVSDLSGVDDTSFTIIVSNSYTTPTWTPQTFCSSDPISLLTAGSPTGGYYTGPGVVGGNSFNPGIGTGTYTLRYFYTNAAGCTDSVTGTVSVTPGPTALLAEANNFSNCNGFTLANQLFTVRVFDGSTGTITNYTIIWGDGTPSYNSATPPTNLAHTYVGQGIYTLTYIITASNGCTDTVTYDVLNTSNPASLNVINPGNTNGCAPLVVTFPLTTTNTDTSIIYTVDFGDGTDTTFPHPPPAFLTHLYDSTSCLLPNAVYTITATATNACLSTQSTVNGPFITEPAEANFIPDGDSIGCVNQVFNFANISIPGFNNACNRFMTYIWDYGDGSPRDTQVVFSPLPPAQTHIYTSTGTYNVTLWAKSFGQTFCDDDSITIPICIDDAPVNDFSVLPDSGCLPLTVTTTNNSYSPGFCLPFTSTWAVTPATGWNLAGTDSLTQSNPTFIFTEMGVYTLSLTTENDCGSTTRDTTIVVQAPPEVTLPADVAYCDTTDIDFGTDPLHQPTFVENLSPIFSYSWNISPNTFQYLNGTDSSSAYPEIRFAPNVYTVIVCVENDCGVDCDTQIVDINAPPIAAFSLYPICQNDTVFFFDSTFVDPINGNALQSLQWDFGNGQTSNLQNPFAFYPIPGVYTVGLRVTDIEGCTDTLSQSITIRDAPTANFSFDTVCANSPTSFNDLSSFTTPFGAPIVGHAWDFGDGSPVNTTANPSHTYTNPGLYTVRLSVTDTNGCMDDTTRQVLVRANPIAYFVPPINCIGDSIALFDSSSVDPSFGTPLDQWFWDFGDGNSSSVQNPRHRYASTGAYWVQLTVTDSFGCSTTYADSVRVAPLPTADFSVDIDSSCTPLSVQFTNSSSPSISFNWRANGQNFSSQENPSAVFVNLSPVRDSIIVISLDILNAGGCRDTAYDTLVVHPRPLVSAQFVPAASCGPDTLILQNNSRGKGASFNWISLNGGASISNASDSLPTIVLPINQSGFDSSYTFRLIVTSEDGCVDSTDLSFDSYTLPTALFSLDSSGCGPFNGQARDSSIAASLYSWSVQPSGVTISDPSAAMPTFNFPANLTTNPIDYSVKLVVTSANGCLDSAIQNVRVFPGPTAQFNSTTSDSCGPLTVQFSNVSNPNDGSSINTLQFTWDFGNGITSQAQDTSVIFRNSGTLDSTYIVALTVTNQDGCSDTYYDTVVVYPNPLAQISFTDSTDCAPFVIDSNVVQAVVLNQANDVYAWKLLDTQGNLLQQYTGAQAVNYTLLAPEDSIVLRLITTNVHGCVADSTERLFYTLPDPIAAFGWDVDRGCSPLSVQFFDSSSVGVTHEWFFNGVLSSTQSSPLGLFTNLSNTTDSLIVVELVVTAGTSCTDTIRDSIVVFTKPAAIFSFDDASVCGPDTIRVLQNSNAKGATQYSWSVNSNWVQLSSNSDPSPSLYVPNLQSSADSVFQLQLIITSLDGCSDTAVQSFRVFSRPIADFSIDSASCGPSILIPNNSSSNASSYFWSVGAPAIIANPSAITPDVEFPVNLGPDSLIYSLQLIAYSDSGCSDTAFRNITIYPKPIADFSMSDTAICTGATVHFTNLSNAQNGEPRSSLTYAWDFGNGVLSATSDTSVVFTNSGVADSTYSIQLIITTQHGCSDTLIRQLTVHPEPRAEINFTQQADCAPFVVDSNNLTATRYPQANDTFRWFANGIPIGLGPNFPGYTLASSGDSVIIMLVVENVHGCRADTATQLFYAIEDPVANFGYNSLSSCSPFQLQLFDSSSAGVSHQWYVNGQLFSTQANPTIVLTNNSTTADSLVQISLVVTAGGSGCGASSSRSFTIFPKPNADFNLPLRSTCAPDTLTISNSSSYKPASQFRWSSSGPGVQWSDTTALSPLLYVADNQTGVDVLYSLQLRVISPDGCSDTVVQNLRVFSRPIAQFSLDNSSCGGVLTPVNQSQFGQNYTWSVTPAIGISNPNVAAPNLTFPTNTTTDSILYRIRLQMTSDSGCVDEVEYIHTVYPKPLAAFAKSDTAVCHLGTVQFTNNSLPYNGESISSMNFFWDFGNGILSNARDTSIQFQNTGIRDTLYRIQLIAESQHGCRDTAVQFVRVYPRPNALFTTQQTLACAPFSIDSLNIQTVPFPQANDQYEWLVNGVLVGTGIHFPGHTIVQDGDTARIAIITTNVHGCTPDTLEVLFRTYVDPVAAFSPSVTSGCGPLSISFADSSQGNVLYDWDFGNGQSSTLSSPTVVFNGNGLRDTTYTVRLITSLISGGCSDTAFDQITVYGTPIAGFQTNVPCQGDSVRFTDTSIAAQSPIVQWSWDFGDGTSSNSRNPVHLFAVGNYNVSLTVTDANGCSHTVIRPLTYRPLPVAAMAVSYGCQPDSACINQSVSFTDNSTLAALGGTLTAWRWDVDGDGLDDYTTQNATHAYTQTGRYVVRLIVQSSFGCVDTTYDTLQVSRPPSAAFSLDRNRGCGPLQVVATDSSSGLIRNILWEVFAEDNNGNRNVLYSSTQSDPNPIPALPAALNGDTTYYISQRVSNCCGFDEVIDTLTVLPIPIPYFAMAVDSGCSPVRITFQTDGLVTGRPDSILFNFGDGSPQEVLLPQISIQPNGDTLLVWNQRSHVFVYNGNSRDTTYIVTLRAISECGDSTYSLPVRVYPNNVQGFFNTSTNAGCAPLRVQFNDFSFNATTVNWCSNFDTINKVCIGALSAQPNPTFVYNNPGRYVAAQFASNQCSIDTVYQIIEVYPSPNAGFNTSVALCQGDTFNFINTSTMTNGTIAGYRWDFGDGDTSNMINPSHAYSSGGSFQVCLEVISANGCIDSICRTVQVNPPAQISFSAENVCLNEQPMQFFDSSFVQNGNIISRVWDFGDGNTSTQLNPLHTYQNPGQYWVKLNTLTDNFCAQSDSILVSVYPIPITDFNYSRTGGDSCGAPQTLTFQNASIGAAGYSWDFDLNNSGNLTSTLVNPSITFTTAGIYTVRLIADNGFGCADTMVRQVRILPTPEIEIDASAFEGCAPFTVNFEDLSNVFDTVNGSQIVAWRWYFSDGTRSVLPDPVRTFEPGSYSVGLAIETNLGCYDTAWFPDLVRVYQAPEVSFSSTLTTEATIAFQSQVLGGRRPYAYYWDFGDGDSAFTPNPIHRYFYNGSDLTYGYAVCLTVIDSNGCSDVYCDTVSLGTNSLFVPNAMIFADGLQGSLASQFLPAGLNFAEYHLRIYDRWGNLIWETTSLDPQTGKPNEAWDGTHRGEPLPQGVYYWRVDGRFRDGTLYRGEYYDDGKQTNVGTITLVR